MIPLIGHDRTTTITSPSQQVGGKEERSATAAHKQSLRRRGCQIEDISALILMMMIVMVWSATWRNCYLNKSASWIEGKKWPRRERSDNATIAFVKDNNSGMDDLYMKTVISCGKLSVRLFICHRQEASPYHHFTAAHRLKSTDEE